VTARLGFARGRLMPIAVLAVLTACVGALRREAIDAPGHRLAEGQPVAAVAHLLERPAPGPFGASAEVELVDGPARGSRLLARLPRDAGLSPAARPGTELRLSGTFAEAETGDGSFDFTAHLRRRGVAGELAVERVRLTGGRRGGLAGALDDIRERALAGIAADLEPVAGAIGQGMVLGADDGVPDTVRQDFRDAGLAHVLSVCLFGQNKGRRHDEARLPVLRGAFQGWLPDQAG
jgi:hypothetical protein